MYGFMRVAIAKTNLPLKDTSHGRQCSSLLINHSKKKVVGNSLQPIGIIITGKLFTGKLHVESYNRCHWSARLDYEARISQYSLICHNKVEQLQVIMQDMQHNPQRTAATTNNKCELIRSFPSVLHLIHME